MAILSLPWRCRPEDEDGEVVVAVAVNEEVEDKGEAFLLSLKYFKCCSETATPAAAAAAAGAGAAEGGEVSLELKGCEEE